MQMNFDKGYLPEGLCLGAQFLLTAVSIIRIYDNREQFPVRHFGPVSTIICALCFFFANVINLLGRIISDSEFKICIMNDSNVMFGLAILYNILRELPFGLLTIKILRASLCFWPPFNSTKVENINRHFVNIMAHQTYFIYVCLVYVCAVNVFSVIETQRADYQDSRFIYEYFCPKAEIFITEKVVAGLRLLTMGFVFYLSVWTYDQLDFKKFLILIFFSSNIFIIPHVFRVLSDAEITKRDSIYYTSFIIELMNSCIIMYYSGINKKLSQPAMQGVLQSWQAFHNLRFGMDVLYQYAIYKDDHAPEDKKINFQCLDHYDYLDEILKLANTRPNYNLEDEIQGIKVVLQRNQLVKQKLGTAATSDIKRKCNDGTIKIEHIKKIEKILSNYCEIALFIEWKKTKSYKFLKQQFINNGDINQKLALFGIPIS